MTKDVFRKYFECYIPVTACNLRCHYCYVGHLNSESKRHELPQFEYSPEYVAKALNRERLGGTCLFNLCGAGETLLPPEMPAYVGAILSEGHFISLVSNMTLTKRIEEILSAGTKEQLERLFFKCSFHYLELQRLGLLDCFSNNIKKIRDAGCSYVVEFTSNDESLPFLDEIKKYSLNSFGALPHVTIARDELSRDQVNLPILTKLSSDKYLNTWRDFNSSQFDFKYSIWEKKIHDFCYAGQWSFCLNLCTGAASQCYHGNSLPNLFKNSSALLVELPVCTHCCEPHCFNGHAFLAFGLVPSMKTPTYADLRDRVCSDGSHWLTPRMRAFFSQKLYDNNREYTPEERERLSQLRQGEAGEISFWKWLGYKIRSPFSERIRRKLRSLQNRSKTE